MSRVHNIFINSANRSNQENDYDFSIYFDNDEIIVKPNVAVNKNVVSFSILNSMYNVNQYTKKYFICFAKELHWKHSGKYPLW